MLDDVLHTVQQHCVAAQSARTPPQPLLVLHVCRTLLLAAQDPSMRQPAAVGMRQRLLQGVLTLTQGARFAVDHDM